MATSKVSPFGRETFIAASDLSGLASGQFNFVKLTTNGHIDVPSEGDLCVVLDDSPALGGKYVAGEYYTCVYADAIKVKAGAALNAGVPVTTDATGQAVAADTGDTINGVTLAPCAQGDLVSIRVGFSGAVSA